MQKKFFAVAAFAFAFAFAFTASAVGASEIYTPATGFLKTGSGMGAKAYQASNVMAAQTALNACIDKGAFVGTKLAVDGKWGPKTSDTFMKFQASQGAKVDGVIGNETAGKLAACSGSTTTGSTTTPTTPETSTTLEGNAGDLEQVNTNDDVEDSVGEGKEEKVTSATFEADGSDIAVTNVRVIIDNPEANTGSDRLNKYVDEVVVYLGNKEVGSADVSDFTRNGNVYTRNISVSNAVIKNGDEAILSVAIKAVKTVDTTGKDWDVAIDSVRFMDGSGAIITLSDTTPLAKSTGVEFVSGTDSDGLEVSKASNSPKKSSLKVESDKKSDEFNVLVAEIEADEDGDDVDVLFGKVTVTSSNISGSDIATKVADKIVVKVGSSSYTAKLSTSNGGTTPGVATYDVDFKSGFTVDAGDTEDAKVYVTFKRSDAYSTSGTLGFKFEVTEAESSDEITATGSAETLGFTLSGSTASTASGIYLAPVLNNDGSATLQKGYIGVTFEAGDALDAVTITAPGTATPGAGKIIYTTSGVTPSSGPVVSIYEGDSIDIDEKMTVGTDKFVKGREYTIVVDIDSITGGQIRPTIEITDINNTPITGIKFVK